MKRYAITLVLAVLIFVGASRGLAAFLCGGLMRQYGLTQNSDMLILGHSHIMLALNGVTMQEKLDMKVSKYCREGVTVAERKLMAEHYLRLHPEASLKYVIYGVDPYLFTSSGLSENSYLRFLPFMDEKIVDAYVKANAPSGVYWRNKILPLCRFADAEIYAGISGWGKTDGESRKTGKVDLHRVQTDIEHKNYRTIAMNPDAVQCFRDTVALFTARGVKVILLNTPIIDLYNALELEKHQAVDALYVSMAEESPLVEYWNFNPGYEKRYELFRDPIHLNRDGQREITQKVIEKLQHGDED